MSRPGWDPTIGQRLAVGFGALLLLLGALAASAFVVLSRNAAAQTEFTDRILPRRERAHELESRVLDAGLAVRAYFLSPSPDHLERHATAAREARGALARLSATPMDEESERLFAETRQHVERYLEMKAGLLESFRTGGPLRQDQEAALTVARDQALAALRTFVALQSARTTEALAVVTSGRRRVTRDLGLAAAVAVLGFVALAWITARAVRTPAHDLIVVAEALEHGDVRPALALARPRDAAGGPPHTRSEMTRLAHAFGAAAAALDTRARRLHAEGQLAVATASSLDASVVARQALDAVVAYLGAEVGVIYGRTDGGTLVPLASYALDTSVSPVAGGEGAPGQAAVSGRTVVVRDIPPDTAFSVRIGFDSTIPRAVAAVPIRFRDEVVGVLLVASLRELDAEAIAFMEAMAPQLGAGLQNARSHAHIERLLRDLRTINDRIQAQNEEIQAQSEEIQAQNEELQAQNEEIHAQTAELHEVTARLGERNAELERLAAELTNYAAQLSDADTRKNEFLAMLAHELRNPMAAMTVSLQLLRRGAPGTDRAARAQGVLERQVHHMTRLIDDLLDVTRVSKGKITMNRERIDLRDVVHTCRDDQAGALESRHQTLEVQMPADAVWVEGDRTRLCQVVNNLLHNALKFTPAAGRVVLALARDDSAGRAVLRVTDTGIGLEPELLGRLFEPFSQGQTTLARSGGGLGLGLALVKALVELHGGTVEARSGGHGTGAEFIVRLALAEAPSAAAGTPRDTVPVRPRRVLLVEDNPDAAWSLREALTLEGHTVEVAASGAEALARAPVFLPELVLCDIGLPEMDGYELARHLRADGRLASTLLVALTGYASDTDRAQSADAGFDAHLAKPLRMEELAAVLAAAAT